MSTHEEFAHLRISLENIQEATNDFADENLIGRGGFGKVYKGKLLLSSGQETDIVARRLHYDYGQGDVEFWTEIMMLSGLKHRNLVSFVGYCDENGEKIIINEYESNGSLDKYLKGSVLTWLQRLQICVGIAHALSYIHYDVGRNYSVIHRNIKSSLDDNWEPKLSGFELAMSNTSERRHRLLLAEVIGTIGYVDPTYKKTGFVTHKSDVYSFGVVLFEVMCGRRAFVPDEQERRSPQFAKSDYKEGEVDVREQSHPPTNTMAPTQANPLSLNNVWLSLCTHSWFSLFNCLWPSPSTNIRSSSSSNTPLPSIPIIRLASFPGEQRSMPIGGRLPSFVDSDGQPKSFVDGQPTSFGRSASFVHSGPPSFDDIDRQPTSFVDGQPTSFGGSESFVHSWPPSLENETI